MNRDATGTLTKLASIEGDNRAIVIGAGMGGLLAARVLASHFREVVVLERDSLPAAPGYRKNVPQGQHVHALLARGRSIVEELFPGIRGDLLRAGAILADSKRDFAWFQHGGYLADPRRGLTVLLQSRPLLEHHIRRRVLGLPNVTILDGCQVTGLLMSTDHQRVIGVRIRRASSEDDVEGELGATLTIDASGRASRLATWLGNVGYEVPTQVAAGVESRYATRLFRRVPGQNRNRRVAVIVASRELRRGGVMMAQEGDQWIVSLSSRDGSQPPLALSSFIDWAGSLEAPDIYDVVRQSVPLNEGVLYRFPRSTRWQYERMGRFPAGVLPFGDAICAFNPVYAQGISVAAIEAAQLSTCLSEGTSDLAKRFFASVTAPIDTAWMMAAAGDLRYVDAPIDLPRPARLANAYMSRLLIAAQHDPVVAEAFHRVSSLVDPPAALRRTSIALRVAFASRPRGSAPTSQSRTTSKLASHRAA